MFPIQLSYLLRSNSRLKCDSYTRSQTVHPPLSHPLPSLSLNAIPRPYTLCRKTLRITLATIQIMRIISLKIPENSANLTSNYTCFEKEIHTRLNVRRTGCVYCSTLLFASTPRFVHFRLFLVRFFASMFLASRLYHLTYNPVLWVPSWSSSGFALSAKKATLTLRRRNCRDARINAKHHLPRKRRPLPTRPWSNIRPSTNQTSPNRFVVKATVRSNSHSKTPRQEATSTPSRHHAVYSPAHHGLH